MIDWYSLLFFAFILLFIILEKINSHRTPYHFIVDGQPIGLSGGTYSLLIQFMTGTTFLFPLFLTIEFQLLSVILLLIEAIFLYFLLIKIKANVDIMGVFLDLKKKPFLIWIFALANLVNLFLQTGLIAYLFQNLYHQGLGIGIGVFLAFCFVYFGLGGYYGLNRIGSILLYGSFFILSFTTLILFLTSGMDIIFEKYMIRYSTFSSGSILNAISCFVTFSLVMIGQTCTSFYFWSSLSSIKENHKVSALRYSLFSWGAFLLAFVVLMINFLVRMDPVVNLLVLAKMMNPFFLHVITYILFMLLVTGVGNNLYSIVSLFFILKIEQSESGEDRSRSNTLIKQGYLLGLVLCLLIGVSVATFYQNFVKWIPFFLSFFASASIPFLFASLTGRFREKTAFLTVLLMMIVELGLIKWIENIWLIAPISGLIAFIIYTLIQKFKIVRK